MERGGGAAGGGGAARIKYQLRPKGPNVTATRSTVASETLLVKGKGVALLTTPLEQDMAYMELHVRKAGPFSVGVSRNLTDAHALAEGPLAWALEVEAAQLPTSLSPEPGGRGGGTAAEAAEADVVEIRDSEVATPVAAKAGDVIGIIFSQSSFPMLQFTLNGRLLESKSVERVRGLVFPALHLKGACGEEAGPCVSFALHEDDWAFKPPSSRYFMLLETRDMI